MSEQIQGGCLCGRVRFAVPAQPFRALLCFCSDCQIVSGASAYAAYVVPLDALVKLEGETSHFTVQSDQQRLNTRHFCSHCGSRVWAELEVGLASVNGMALDDRDHFSPSHNHRLNNAPQWC